MKLQRYDHWADIGAFGLAAEVVAVESRDGEYYRAADVDSLLARIREAVAAERAQVSAAIHAYPDSPIDRARAALDALLSGEG